MKRSRAAPFPAPAISSAPTTASAPAISSTFLLVLLSLAALQMTGCRREAEIPQASSRQKVKKIAVSERTVAQELSSFGTLSYRTKTEITTTTDGTVTELLAAEGTRVEKNQLLARLKNIQLSMRRQQALSAVSSARSALELAEAQLWEGQLQVEARILSLQKSELEIEHKKVELEELARTLANKEKLFDVGGATEETMASLRLSYTAARTSLTMMEKDLAVKRIGLRDEDIASQGMQVPRDEESRERSLTRINTLALRAEREVARSALESAETELASVDQLLAELEIRSPVTGVVGAKYVEPGEQVAANTRVYTVIDTSDMYAVFPLAEADAVRVVEGASVEVQVDALSQTTLHGRVERISPVIDPQAGTVTLKALVRNSGGRLKPGMFVRVRLVYGNARKVVAVPQSAISQKKGNQARVFLVVNNRAFLKEIVLGRELGGSFAVEEGLKGGDTVIDSPSPLLQEGEEVEAE